MLDFKPPKDSPFLIGLVKLLLPAVLRFGMHGARVEVVGDGLSRFRALAGKRTVICPNHPCSDDPQTMFAFSAFAGEDFNYLAAREVFDWNHGLRGWCFQHVGCYSVVRGAVDRESFKTTKRLIVEGRKKLVIFPEGEISRQNDTLMPLESGVAQMSFWAQEELGKTQPGEPVFIQPVAIKYTYRRDITRALALSLSRLEDRLDVSSDLHDPLYARLRRIAERIIQAIEREYGQKPGEGQTLNDRINSLRAAILKKIARFMEIELNPSMTQLDWVRVLRNALDELIYADESEMSPYDKRIHDEQAAEIRPFYRDLDRVVNFIAIYDGYLRDRLTQERFADVVGRFEMEVFGKTSPKGERTILIDVGRPINLLERLPDYRASKKEAVNKVNEEMSQQIASMLEALDLKRPAIFVD